MGKTYRPFLVWYLSSLRIYKYADLTLRIPPGVFHPAFFYSTGILLRFLEAKEAKGKKVLELGAGSGLISMVLSTKGAMVTASDISTLVVENGKENNRLNKLSVSFVQSDLFEQLPEESFDWIVINPPYYPKDPHTASDHAWYCGKEFDYFKALFQQLPDHIAKDGKVWMILSDDCELIKIKEMANEADIDMSIVHEKKGWSESSFIFELTLKNKEGREANNENSHSSSFEQDLASVNRAFSTQSEQYDSYDASNEILTWMRKQVRKHVLHHLKPSNRMLELNAGTGLDALYFANKGYTVCATDLSDGMVKQIQQKIAGKKPEVNLSVTQTSYTNLSGLRGKKFDYVFSNFGGLNCIPDLKAVTQQLPELLNPGAYVTFVIMPPVCFWEIGKVFKGKFKEAFRRFHKKGSMAHLEGEYFPTFYFSAAEAKRAFGPEFRTIKLEGLATFSPPPHADRFPVKYPGTYRLLTRLDEALATTPPFRSWADHIILTMQYNPEK